MKEQGCGDESQVAAPNGVVAGHSISPPNPPLNPHPSLPLAPAPVSSF